MAAMDDNDRLRAGTLPEDPAEGCGPPIDIGLDPEELRGAAVNGNAAAPSGAEDMDEEHVDRPEADEGARSPDQDLDLDGTPLEDPPPDIAARLAAEDEAPLGPTAAEPLRGLTRLAPRALLGRARILERAREPVVYAWQDIAVAGTVIMLAGGPSGGKTTLLFLLLVARMNLGAPVPVLGRRVTPAPIGQWIVLIEAEHGEGSTCRKLVRSCALADVGDEALDRVIVVARKAVRIGSPEWVDVEKMVAAGLVSDIALDTLARVAPADANDEQEQAAIFEIVAQTIEAAPPALAPMVWIAAHTRKGDASSGEDVSGSAQRVGQADSLLMVKGEKIGGQTVSSTVTFWKLREEPDDYPAPVTFEILKVAGAEELRVVGAAAKVEAEDGQPIEARIEGLLASGAKTKNAMRDALKRSDADMEAALGNLFTARRIRTTSIKVRGVDRKAFELRQDAPPPVAPTLPSVDA